MILANECKSPIFCSIISLDKTVVSEYKVPSDNNPIFPFASLNIFEIFILLYPPYPYKGICYNKKCLIIFFLSLLKCPINIHYTHFFVLLRIAAISRIMFDSDFSGYWTCMIWTKTNSKCFKLLTVHCQYHACTDSLSISKKL